MSLDQSIRWKETDPRDTLNPNGLYNFLIVPKDLAGVGSPVGVVTAPLGSTYTDTATGQEYIMGEDGNWTTFINYSTFAPAIPDPLVRNEIDVNTIKGNSTADVSVDLGVAGILKVGPTLAPSRVEVLADGSIVTSSATSSVIVANGLGAQVGYGPSSIVSVGSLSVIGNSGVSIATNAGDVTVGAANNVILDPSNIVLSNKGIYMASGQTYTSQDDGTSGVLVGTDSVKLRCSGSDILSASSTALSATTQILSNSGAPQFAFSSEVGTGLGLAAGFAKLRVQAVGEVLSCSATEILTSKVIHGVDGSAAAPSFSFSSSNADGYYSLGAGVGSSISVGGVSKFAVTPTTVFSMVDVKPSVTNTVDLGSNALAWRDIYSINAPTIVSDGRLKKDIEELSDQMGLSFVESLKPVSFKWKDESDKYVHLGLIAQDVETSLHGKGYAVDSFAVVKHHFEGEHDKYTMCYDELIASLIKSVKELSARVKELESKIH